MTAPCLAGIVEIANRLFPFDMAEKWDNCGIQIGDPRRTVRSIAFSLDPTPETVRFASDHSCKLLITHHPVLLEPVRTLTPDTLSGRVLLEAARAEVDILSLHTNLDAAPGGLNDRLATRLGLDTVSTPLNAPCARLGSLPETSEVYALARKWAADLDISHVRVISHGNKSVRRVFCASGSGMSYLPQAIQYGADVMVTGDVRYHAAREALEFGIPIIDAGHYGLEKMAVQVLFEAFEEEFLRMNVHMDLFACDTEREPFVEVYNP